MHRAISLALENPRLKVGHLASSRLPASRRPKRSASTGPLLITFPQDFILIVYAVVSRDCTALGCLRGACLARKRPVAAASTVSGPSQCAERGGEDCPSAPLFHRFSKPNNRKTLTIAPTETIARLTRWRASDAASIECMVRAKRGLDRGALRAPPCKRRSTQVLRLAHHHWRPRGRATAVLKKRDNRSRLFQNNDAPPRASRR
jgi:hypothetical protein